MHTFLLLRSFATLGATGTETSLKLTALNSPHPIHDEDGHYSRNRSCITLLWLHHKMSISFYKSGLVSSHQSVGKWLIFYVFCSKNILTKLVGYQQPTCLCQYGIRGWKWNHFAFMWIVFTFVELFSFMWGRNNCAREMVFRFTCAVLWKMHGWRRIFDTAVHMCDCIYSGV